MKRSWRYWARKIRDIPSNIFLFFRNLIRWMPIIWADEDFDFGYLIRVLRFKIEKMDKFWKSGNTYSANGDRVSRQLAICKTILRRLEEDDYCRYEFDEIDRVHGKTKIVRTPVEGLPGHTRLEFVDRTDTKRKAISRAFKRAREIKRADMDLLFSIMNKHLLNWWD